ncbi:MAG: adenylate/guanylate cyclase domain-containing protein, partial [Woeseiaceae bacterium]
ATFISDMANFSSLSRRFGVCHFLKLIHRAREVIGPIVAEHRGRLLKCDADNCYAFFPSADDALQASIEMNAAFFRANQQLELPDHIYLSVGIDYGDLLLVGHEDFYGDPVNTASKLGEDLAIRGEILVTERAIAESKFVAPENVERMVARISDIEISYLRLPMMQAASTDFRPRPA